MIQGSASLYDGNTQGAQSTYKYFAPSLSATRRLFAELTSDSEAFNQFLVKGSKALGAIASRRNDLADLTTNANQALGAIASQNEALDRTWSPCRRRFARPTRPSSTCAPRSTT